MSKDRNYIGLLWETALLGKEWSEIFKVQWEINNNLEFFTWKNYPSNVKRNNNKNGRNLFATDLHFRKCKKTFREKENDVGQKRGPKQKMKNTREKLNEGKIMFFLFWIDLTNNCLFEIIVKITHLFISQINDITGARMEGRIIARMCLLCESCNATWERVWASCKCTLQNLGQPRKREKYTWHDTLKLEGTGIIKSVWLKEKAEKE